MAILALATTIIYLLIALFGLAITNQARAAAGDGASMTRSLPTYVSAD